MGVYEQDIAKSLKDMVKILGKIEEHLETISNKMELDYPNDPNPLIGNK